MSYLASGYPYPEDRPALANYFRPGNPMVVAAFNYPGRGKLLLSSDLRATGAPDFMGDTPGNTTGQDYGGELSFDAAEAVAGVLLGIVEDLQRQWSEHPALTGSLGSLGHRLIACSSSWGLNPASRWVANTEHSVHALVDWEGPTDSSEFGMVSEAYNPYGYPDLDGTVPTAPALTPRVFMNWAAGDTDSFPYWFRPPAPDHLATSSQVTDWAQYASLLPSALQAPWRAKYDHCFPRAGAGSLEEQISTFWQDRVATRWLPEVASGRTAYVRIQGSEDHNQPVWMYQRHAIKAMNAAFSGSGQHVYFAGAEGYWYYLSQKQLVPPDRMTAEFDIDNPDPAGDHTWGDCSQFWPTITEDLAWSTQVDLVRWAMQTDFHWRVGPALGSGPYEPPFDPFERRTAMPR